MSAGTIVIIVVIVLLILIFGPMTIKIVQEYERGVIFRPCAIGNIIERAARTRPREIKGRRNESGIHGKEIARGFQHAGRAHAMTEKRFCGSDRCCRAAAEFGDASALRPVIGFGAGAVGINTADFRDCHSGVVQGVGKRFKNTFSTRVGGRGVIRVGGKAMPCDFSQHYRMPEHGLFHVFHDPEGGPFTDIQSIGEGKRRRKA